MPLMPAQNRIAGHVRLLGILWIAISAFRLIPGLVLTSMFQYGFPFPGAEHMPPFVPGLLHTVGSAMIVGAVLGIGVGIGLLQRLPWARLAAMVLGGINLLDMPLGTALGIYTLWVLLPAESEQQYHQIAADSAGRTVPLA